MRANNVDLDVVRSSLRSRSTWFAIQSVSFGCITLGLKRITCVSANMPKKIRVGKSENLFIFCLIFVC